MKKTAKTAFLMISPETGRLPKNMGPLARYVSGKSGGQAEKSRGVPEADRPEYQSGSDTALVALAIGPDSEGHPPSRGYCSTVCERSWR